MMNEVNRLLNIVDKIKEEGNIVMIKFDGEREENKITVLISYPYNSKEMIRYEGEDLVFGLDKVIAEYYRR